MKEITDKLDFIKIKIFLEGKKNLIFYSKRDNIKRMRRQATEWEKIFAKTHLIKKCYPKYTKKS